MKKYLIASILIIGAFFLGRFLAPEKVSETVKKVEVVKWKTKTRVIIKPDGTRIEEEVNEHIIKEVNERLIAFDTKKYLFTISATPQANPTYMLGISKKFIGNLYLGGYGRTDGEYGLSLTYRF